MNVENLIVFIAKFDYLSFPQYFAITPHLNKFKTMFLDLHDPRYKIKDAKSKVKPYFDYYLKPNFKEIESLFIILRKDRLILLLKSYIAYLTYKQQLFMLLDTIKPKIIVASSDIGLNDRIFSLWCKKNKIPYNIIQPSFIDGKQGESKNVLLFRKFRYFIFRKILRVHIYPNQMVYGNENLKANLLLWGKNFVLNPKRKRMFFVGNPAFDKFFSNFSSKRKIKNKIVICTQNIENLFGKELFDMINRYYIHLISSRKDLFFFIKVHPRESIEKYRKVFKNSNFPNIIVVKDCNLYELYRKCDIQISMMSYSAIEAVSMGLPIITIRPPIQYRNYVDHFKGEINLSVSNGIELVKAVEIALSDQYWDVFLDKRLKYFNKKMYSSDGLSGKRAARIIEDSLKL